MGQEKIPNKVMLVITSFSKDEEVLNFFEKVITISMTTIVFEYMVLIYSHKMDYINCFEKNSGVCVCVCVFCDT